jgi:threonine/homoserine/homoserine lactone efflux protein
MMTVLKIFGIFVLVYEGLSLLLGGCRKTFLKVTTSETKNGFLLVETFRKLFNPQNYGHQGSFLGGLSL